MFIKLHPEGSPCSKYDDCPVYFSLYNYHKPAHLDLTCISMSARSCVCEPRLATYTNHCNITNGVGQITQESGKSQANNFESVTIIHLLNCPFDYCVNDQEVFPFNNYYRYSVCIATTGRVDVVRRVIVW